MDRLVGAVERILSCWTALNLAVESGWGGSDSLAKRDQLKSQLINYLCTHKIAYIDEIQDIILDSMNNLFYTNLEDNSDREIAEILTKLHHQLQNNDLTLLNILESQINPCKITNCQTIHSESEHDYEHEYEHEYEHCESDSESN